MFQINDDESQLRNHCYIRLWISRLNKTWAALSRKDRQQYERMVELFSDKNNWEQLRSHVNSLKLPMIPYLGVVTLFHFSGPLPSPPFADFPQKHDFWH